MSKVFVIGWAPKQTTPVASSDSAQSFSDSIKYYGGSAGSRKAQRCLVTVEDAPIRFAFGTAPTSSFGHKADIGATIVLDSWPQIDNFQFINAISGSNATLQVTMEF